jgi:hypothetical protein
MDGCGCGGPEAREDIKESTEALRIVSFIQQLLTFKHL